MFAARAALGMGSDAAGRLLRQGGGQMCEPPPAVPPRHTRRRMRTGSAKAHGSATAERGDAGDAGKQRRARCYSRPNSDVCLVDPGCRGCRRGRVASAAVAVLAASARAAACRRVRGRRRRRVNTSVRCRGGAQQLSRRVAASFQDEGDVGSARGGRRACAVAVGRCRRCRRRRCRIEVAPPALLVSAARRVECSSVER